MYHAVYIQNTEELWEIILDHLCCHFFYSVEYLPRRIL